jgi:hypothetical protein
MCIEGRCGMASRTQLPELQEPRGQSAGCTHSAKSQQCPNVQAARAETCRAPQAVSQKVGCEEQAWPQSQGRQVHSNKA